MITHICSQPNQRVFVVGDIHGELGKLNDKLNSLLFDRANDLLISVGDLIDRGPDSLGCLELIDEPWFKCVRGNHEEMMVASVVDKNEFIAACWMRNGGDWYLSLDPSVKLRADSLARKIKNEVPYIIELSHKDRKIVICHADYPGEQYDGMVNSSDLEDVTWSRDRIQDFVKNGNECFIRGADLFVFGHTPIKQPVRSGNCLWIDTGAVFGRELTVLEL